MAPAPEARRGGLNLGNPGAKEYLIIGGGALGLALLYFWWKGRQTAATPAATTGGAPSTPTGLSTASLSAWIHDHTSSSTTTTRDDDDDKDKDKDGDKDGGGKKRREVQVPDVIGEKYPAAARKLAHAGLVARRSEPYVGVVRGERPKQGTKVRRGSSVVLSGRDRH